MAFPDTRSPRARLDRTSARPARGYPSHSGGRLLGPAELLTGRARHTRPRRDHRRPPAPWRGLALPGGDHGDRRRARRTRAHRRMVRLGAGRPVHRGRPGAPDRRWIRSGAAGHHGASPEASGGPDADHARVFASRPARPHVRARAGRDVGRSVRAGVRGRAPRLHAQGPRWAPPSRRTPHGRGHPASVRVAGASGGPGLRVRPLRLRRPRHGCSARRDTPKIAYVRNDSEQRELLDDLGLLDPGRTRRRHRPGPGRQRRRRRVRRDHRGRPDHRHRPLRRLRRRTGVRAVACLHGRAWNRAALPRVRGDGRPGGPDTSGHVARPLGLQLVVVLARPGLA